MDTQWRLGESPHVATTLVPPLSIPCPRHYAQRGTMASYRLAAVFGTWPILHPASLRITPEGHGGQTPSPTFLNGTLNTFGMWFGPTVE